MTIKNFSIEYDSINSRNIFTNGDTINGRIIVEVSKEIKVQSLVFIAKGRANVCWHEQHGQHVHVVYRSKENYYDVKQHILRETRQDGTEVIGRGRHVFPFSFKIPDRKMPSTFKASIGKIVHKIKAELKQSMRLTQKAKTHFTFVSKADMDTPGLMEPQFGSKDKTVSAFGSGTIAIDFHTRRMGYYQGEAFEVTADIKNNSSRSVKPKFVLYEKKSFLAQGRRRLYTNTILKDKCDPVASGSHQTVKKVISIPPELPPSILNCAIIKLEYRLKLYLDIKMATDPEIKFPVVVLPVFQDPDMRKKPASEEFGAFGYVQQPGWSAMAYPPPAPPHSESPPPYGACADYPSYNKF
ncbi:arrestin domain-containing protein 3-like [Sphaeramia orbicularis]|uniref:Arrestin domain-containing protein 3-like n=1 Tax=Sphaeramia orbicularis TaxID=375764 RepID=A0A673CM91_9TELE|nr:arrestin domain-containing protein 3-like [Sphaeramia orbicularis]